MKRISPLSWLVLPFLFLCFSPTFVKAGGRILPIQIHAQCSGPADRMYFHSASGDVEGLLVFRKKLISLGARHVNCFIPFTLVCEMPADLDYRPLIAGTDIVPLEERDIEMDGTTDYIHGPKWVKQCYQTMDRLQEDHNPEILQTLRHDNFVMPLSEANPRPRRPIEVASTPATAREMTQNSEFMVGDILVLAVYPESQGHNQDWTTSDLSAAASAVIRGGMYFQQSFLNARIDFVFKSFSPAFTALEPIESNLLLDNIWVADVMNNMGYEGTISEYQDMVHEFNETWREKLGTDWVFTCFVVNSLQDEDHLFENSKAKVAVQHLGGPYCAIPFPAMYSGGWGQSAFTQAFIMETCRIFWAFSEDPQIEAPPYENDCDDSSGYLNVKNWNKTVEYDPIMHSKKGCSHSYHPEMCTMNYEDMFYFFWSDLPCDYTLGMVGLIDQNNNNVPDAVDAPPVIQFATTARETVFSNDFELNFQAVSTGVPNNNPHQDPATRITYALPVKDVNFFLNEVGPMVVLPLDGVSDETVEEFKIKLTDLLPGLTEVDLISRNILGSTSSPYKKYLYYLGLCFKHFSFGFSNNGIQIRWDLLGETFNAKFDLHRKETSLVPYDSVIVHDIPYHPNSQFTPFTCFDQDVQPGRKYIYYVEGKFNTVYRGETITITQLSHEFDVIASLKISKGRLMSLPSPNPFRDDMWISINVPASYREAGSSDVSPAVPGGRTTQRTAVEEPVPTWVKVKIFDAAGRKIKDLYEDRIYETIRTISWDGTNNNLERLPTGIYFLKVEAGPFTQTEKVMIVR